MIVHTGKYISEKDAATAAPSRAALAGDAAYQRMLADEGVVDDPG